MKHRLKLKKTEQIVVISSLKNQLHYSTEGYGEFIQIVLDKVKQSAQPELDGMEMRVIVQALVERANQFLRYYKISEYEIFSKLAKYVDQERTTFQLAFLKNRRAAI